MNSNILEAKKAVVSEVKEAMQASSSAVVVEYRGLSVAEITELRRALSSQNAKLSVYKNSMVERASEDLGYGELTQYLTGPNALVTCADPIVGPKVLAKFAKKHDHLVIKGGLIEGKVVDSKSVIALAKLPGKDGMISMLLSVLQAPMRNLACAINAVAEKQ